MWLAGPSFLIVLLTAVIIESRVLFFMLLFSIEEIGQLRNRNRTEAWQGNVDATTREEGLCG